MKKEDSILEKGDITDLKDVNFKVSKAEKRLDWLHKVRHSIAVGLIGCYILIILASFLLFIFGVCEECYPPFISRFEMLIAVVAGFYFGEHIKNRGS